jgi:hypothetical protein
MTKEQRIGENRLLTEKAEAFAGRRGHSEALLAEFICWGTIPFPEVAYYGSIPKKHLFVEEGLIIWQHYCNVQ